MIIFIFRIFSFSQQPSLSEPHRNRNQKQIYSMSQQRGGLLETNQSFAFNRDKAANYHEKSIDANKFFAWQKDNMYKSSYNQFHSFNANTPKNTAIPGYQGFVPGHRADSLYAKSNTLIAKKSFSKERLDVNRTGLASTGFNITKQAFLDQSKLASSSKYGKTALQTAHPNWNEQWQTTTKMTYEDPRNVPNPLYRESDKNCEGKLLKNKQSGYQQNAAFWDGTGWKPHPILNATNIATEYRNRFNPERQFHRTTEVSKQRKMNPTETNYKFNY